MFFLSFIWTFTTTAHTLVKCFSFLYLNFYYYCTYTCAHFLWNKEQGRNTKKMMTYLIVSSQKLQRQRNSTTIHTNSNVRQVRTKIPITGFLRFWDNRVLNFLLRLFLLSKITFQDKAIISFFFTTSGKN